MHVEVVNLTGYVAVGCVHCDGNLSLATFPLDSLEAVLVFQSDRLILFDIDRLSVANHVPEISVLALLLSVEGIPTLTFSVGFTTNLASLR